LGIRIIAWKLCTNMQAEEVTDTIELALAASGCDQAVVRHKCVCSVIMGPDTSQVI